MRRVVSAVWPLVFWMAFVFLMSTEVGASTHTSRILVPLLHWLNPDLSPLAIERVNFLVRKAGHVTEYAVLALLVLRALRVSRATPVSHWSWPLALLAFGASAAYGASDEIHQLFVPTRGPSFHDVLIDSSGAAFGLALAFFWKRWRSAERGSVSPR